MRKISNLTKRDGYSSIQNEDGYVSENFGWETKTSNLVPNLITPELVNYVNKKHPLKNLLSSLEIHLEERYSPSGWNYVRICPFPDHQEKTPSFGYNSIDDRFYCFGCKRGGGSVQFLAYIKNISKTQAIELLSKDIGPIEEIIFDVKSKSQDLIDGMLLEFSNYVRDFIQAKKSYKAIMYAESVTWSLDLYLTKHISSLSINVENLSARLDLLKKKLDDYK